MSQTTCGTRARLHVRETLPTPVRGRRERVVDRLSDLVPEGALVAYDVDVWDRRIPADGSGDAETRECYSWETGERGTWLVLPALCLSVYEDGELAAVYPHRDGDTYQSVWDGIESLETESDGPADERDSERLSSNSG